MDGPTDIDKPWHCRWPIACDNNLTCPGCHPSGTDAECRTCQARSRPPHPMKRYDRNGRLAETRWYDRDGRLIETQER